MISRVAENCFWLFRYMERAESMARLLRVNRSFLLDIELPDLEQWYPVLVVSGEEHRFIELYPEKQVNDENSVQDYLTWDEACPVGIATSVGWARENARIIREVISLEMWQSINELWHRLQGSQGRRLFRRDRDAFYKSIKDAVALFHGTCHDTVLHEEPFDFMRLGMLIERAAQTARIMDVKYHLLGPTSGSETAVESAQWAALLRSCSGEDSFFRRHRSGLHSVGVVGFLLKEERFPRSVYHCLARASDFLHRIGSATGSRAHRSVAILDALVASLAGKTAADIVHEGLHGELTRIIDTITDICNEIHGDYFDPSFPELPANNGEHAASS